MWRNKIAEKIGFKVMMLFVIVIIYFVSASVIFFFFNLFYMKSIREKLIENNFESAKIAVTILNDEKNRIRTIASEIVRDYPLQYALIRKINLYYSNFTLDGKNNKIKEIDTLGYMRIISKLKQSLSGTTFENEGEKGIAIYDKEFNLIARTSNLQYDEIENWREPYLKTIRDTLERREVEVGSVSIDATGLIIKKNNNIYIKGVDDIVSSLGEEKSVAQGTVIVTKKINQDMLKYIKTILNKDVILFMDDKVKISTFNIEEKDKSFFDLAIKREIDINGGKYIKINNNKKLLGISFYPILDFQGETAGYLGTVVDLNEMEFILKKNTNKFWILVFIFSLILLVLTIAIIWKLFKPFSEIVDLIKEIAKGNYGIKYKHKVFWELKTIVDSIIWLSEKLQDREKELKNLNYDLENKVLERTKELEKTNEILKAKTLELEEKRLDIVSKNKKLNEALENLKRMQNQIIEQEKISYLGEMFDEIVNKLSIPLNESEKAISYLENDIKYLDEILFLKSLNDTKISKVLSKFEKNIEKVSDELEKMSDIINSFKQVSISFIEKEIKDFNLKYYLEETINIIFSKYKNTKVKLEFYCDKDITIRNYPAVFYYIFNNLISNSIYHAFETNNEGKIIIEIEYKYDKIVIVYYDNGKGMSENVIKNIFQPFFTTAKEKGKLGLGMSIVYKIVTQTLKGNINIESNLGTGTKFIIEFPANIEGV